MVPIDTKIQLPGGLKSRSVSYLICEYLETNSKPKITPFHHAINVVMWKMFSRLHQILTASKSNRNLWKTVGAQRRQCGSKIIKAKSYNFTGKAHLQKVISNIHTRQDTYRDVAFQLCRYLLEACLYKHCARNGNGPFFPFMPFVFFIAINKWAFIWHTLTTYLDPRCWIFI